MKFEGHKLTEAERAYFRQLSRLPWQAQFHKTLDNPTAPGGKVDMWILLDDDSGDQIAALSVPHGEQAVPHYIAGCCTRPWFVEPQPDEPDASVLAVAFNRAVHKHAGGDDVNAQEVAVAALSIFRAYVEAMPEYARQDFANRMLTINNRAAGVGK